MKAVIDIILADMRNDIDNENGVFDELATKVGNMILTNLNTSYVHADKSLDLGDIYLDGVCLGNDNKLIIYASKKYGDEEIITFDFNEVDRDALYKFLKSIANGNVLKE